MLSRHGLPAAFVLLSTMCSLFAQTPSANVKEKTYTRKEITDILANDRKIVTPHGIEKLISVQINGTTQWLSIRGKDIDNPILLFIHGGPGGPFMPTAWSVQFPWEDYFTVVQWDQRGAGKTYESNDPKAISSTMTIEQMTSDASEVVRYLRNTYGKKKIFIVAHSWGTVLGLGVAESHPEWLYAYVGTGQYINSARNEADGYKFSLDEAERNRNAEAEKELRAIAPYPGDIDSLSYEKIGAERKWVAYYGGVVHGRTDMDFDDEVSSLSPDYSQEDLNAMGPAAMFSASHLLKPLLKFDQENTTNFKCPVFLFEGRHDFATSHLAAAEWFAHVKAPLKKLVWFENSAHMVMEEESGRFLVHLVTDVRPLAVRAGDAPPEELSRDSSGTK